MPNITPQNELYAPEFLPEWERYKLHELAEWINGLAFKNINFSATGVPVVKIAEVKNGITGQTKFTTGAYDPKYSLRRGDMLFCWSGQPETSIDTYIWNSGDGWLNQHIFKVLPDGTLVDGRYFFYLLRYLRPTFVRIARNKQTTGLGHVTKGDLKNLTVALPPRDYQQKVAASLTVLDDKLDSNRRALKHLGQLFSLQFQRLIGDDSFVMAPLADITTVTKGVSYKSVDLVPSRTSLVTLKCFDRMGGYKREGLKPYAGPYKPGQVVEPGELAVAQTDLTQGAEVVGRAIRVPKDLSADTLVASLDLVVVRPVGDMPIEYLQGILTDERFRQHCRSHTTGTTVLHLAKDAIPSYQAPVVSQDAQLKFAELARPIMARIDALNRECLALEAAQAIVLPELVSGRLRLPQGLPLSEEVPE